jgi:hypothetical protein
VVLLRPRFKLRPVWVTVAPRVFADVLRTFDVFLSLAMEANA